MTQKTIILSQPGFPALDESNIGKFASKMEKFLADGEFNWDLMDRAGLTFKFAVGDKCRRAIKAFEEHGGGDSIRARDAIIAISERVRSGSLQVHFKPGSAAERDIMPALMKDLGERNIKVPSSSPEYVAEDFDMSSLEEFIGL